MTVISGKHIEERTQIAVGFVGEEGRHPVLPVEQLVGSGQVRGPGDAGKQRRVAELDIDAQAAIQADEDRQLNEYRQAAAEHVEVVLLIQLLHRGVLLHRIVGIT